MNRDPGQRASTGLKGLDEILGGGFPRGKICLISGDPGAGKTTLGLHFLMEGVRRGEAVAYVLISESENELRGLAQSHGWSMDGITVLRADDHAERDYSFFTPSEVELSEKSSNIVSELERLSPSRVVFDSLSEVRLLAQDPLRYRRQILALKKLFDHSRATVLLTDFVTEDGDRQLESLCHGIIDLEQLSPEYGGQRRRIRVRKMREAHFRDGYHDIQILPEGLIVYPRLIAAEHYSADPFRAETCSTGLAELDSLLGGGLDRGTSTLLLGPAGAGKSTLAAQCAKAAVERGERAAFFVFDEVPNTLMVRGEGLGFNVRRHVSRGMISIRQINPAQLSPGHFAHMVREEVENHHARMVVIDSINGYTSAMPEEHHLSAHLHELLAYLNQTGVVTVLVMTQQGIVGTMQAPIDLSYLADAVLLLRYFEARGEIRQAISVVKRRTGSHERTIREMLIDGHGFRLGRPLVEFSGVMSGNLHYSGNDLLSARNEVASR